MFSLSSAYSALSSVRFVAFGGSSAYSFSFDDITVDSVAVPESASMALLGLGLLGLGVSRRRKQ